MRKRNLTQAVTAALVLAVLWAVDLPAPAAQERAPLEKVTWSGPWILGSRHAPYFVARERGYYREQGLDVQLVRGYGSSRTAKQVEVRQAQFGNVDMGTVVNVLAKGASLKAVGVLYARNPQAVFAIPEIKAPKDLEGRRVASVPGASSNVLFPSFAKLAGIDQTTIKWVTMAPDLKVSSFERGAVDAILGFDIDESPAMLVKGVKFNVIPYASVGVINYGESTTVHTALLVENPGLVRRFLRATYQAMKDVLKNPDEAVEIVHKSHPELDRAVGRMEIRKAIHHYITEDQARQGLGWMNRDVVRATRDTIAVGYDLKGEIPVDRIYTNDYLPGLRP